MAELYWAAGDDHDTLFGFIEAQGAPVCGYLEYLLGSRELDAEFLPTWITGAPSAEQWRQASEIRLFWADCCVLVVPEQGLAPYSVISEDRALLSYFGDDKIQATGLLSDPKSRPIATRQDWERFVPNNPQIPRFHVVEYYHPSQPQAPFAWRIRPA